VQPSILTISCAAGNDYHHPHPRVVSLLKQRSQSIRLYRTDLEGTITAVSDGKKISVTSEQEVASNRLYLTGDEVAGKQSGSESSKKKAAGRGSD
jgi:beta-lactamase superfamily II metal-dependent hydrolase